MPPTGCRVKGVGVGELAKLHRDLLLCADGMVNLSLRCILGDIRRRVCDPSSRKVEGFRHLFVVCPSPNPESITAVERLWYTQDSQGQILVLV